MRITTAPITVLPRAAAPRTVPRAALPRILPKMRILRIAITNSKDEAGAVRRLRSFHVEMRRTGILHILINNRKEEQNVYGNHIGKGY
jgi:hypothetical protein